DAIVDIVVGIGPKVVIRIRPVNVIEQVVIGVGPEQGSEPAEDHTATPPRPGRTRERTVEARLPELRSQCHIGDGAVPEHPSPRTPGARRGPPARAPRRPGDPVARPKRGTPRPATPD